MEPSPIPAGGILFSGMDPTSWKRVDMGGRAGEMRFSGMDPTSRKRADTGGVLFSGTDPTSRKRADTGGVLFSGTDPTSRKRADTGAMIFSGSDPTSRQRADMGGRAGGVLFSVDPTSRMWVDMSGHGSKEHDRHALLEQTRDRRLAVRRRNSFATEIQKSMKVKKAFEVARANYFFAFGVHNQQRVHSYSGDSELLCQLMLFLLNAYEDTHASEFSQVCNLLLHYLRADEAMFLDALECLLHPHSRESSLSSEFGNRLNFAKLSYLSRLNRSQWSVLRSSLGKYPDHTLAAENYSFKDNNRNSLCWVHTMNGFSGPETSSSSQKELKTTFVGIMDGSRKRAASNANAKSSSPDEDFGNDFLSSWKVPKSEDIVDFNVKSVLKSSKNFISDHINYLGLNGPFETISSCKMGMFDPNNAEEGASGPKNLSPSVQSFEILNASNSSILNAPSSTWPITDQSTVTSQVPKSGKDTLGSIVESVLKSSKSSIFDSLDGFGPDGPCKMGMYDLDFSSPLKRKSKHSSSNGNYLSEGRKETEKEYFSFDFNGAVSAEDPTHSEALAVSANSKEPSVLDLSKLNKSTENSNNEQEVSSQSRNTSTENPYISRRSMGQSDSHNIQNEAMRKCTSLSEGSYDSESFGGTLLKPLRKTSSETKNVEEGTSGPKNLSSSIQRKHKHVQPEKLRIMSGGPYCKPGLQGLSTTSLNAKHGLELLSAGNSSILNAPSSTGHTAEQNDATSQVVIEYMNLYFEFPAERNSTISSVISLALRSKGITAPDSYFSCQLDVYSGHEVVRNTGVKTGSILHVHLRTRGGKKERRTADHVELDLYINRLKSKHQPLWFEKVDLPYDLWWDGLASEVQLAADSRMALKLILDSLERVHESGYCYNGSFPVDHMYYNSKLHVVEIISSDAILYEISPLGLFNDYTIVETLIKTYFSYVRVEIRRYPMYVEALLSEIATVSTKPHLCSNPISRAALSRPLCIMSSSQRLNIFTSVIIYANSSGSFKATLRAITSQWRHEFIAAQVRIPEEFLARYGYKPIGGRKKKEKVYADTLFSHSDYARCFISHSKMASLPLRRYQMYPLNLQNLSSSFHQCLYQMRSI